jgi:1-acyl-sn-glycerol-3-phosphate acyltransferase
MMTLRSTLFLLGAVVVTAIFGILVPLGGLFGYRPAARLAAIYAGSIVKWVEWTCGITHEVRGWENVPRFPVVIMAKHQSAWETLFMASRFPPQCWIVKRELLWLPFVGWGLMAIRCIAIDRSSGMTAREQIVAQGARRIRQGMWISIFPEGTRPACAGATASAGRCSPRAPARRSCRSPTTRARCGGAMPSARSRAASRS